MLYNHAWHMYVYLYHGCNILTNQIDPVEVAKSLT